MVDIKLKFGGWVAGTKWTLTIPHLGGQIHQEGGGTMEWRLHSPSPIPYYNPKTAWTIEH